MIDLTSVELGIDTNFGATGTEEIQQNVAVIISTPQGSVVSDRAFGINFNIVDRPLLIAKGLLIQNYTEAVRTYEPRAEVTSVTFNTDPDTGLLIPKVVVNIVS